METSNEEKVLFPDPGLTKGDLIAFYEDIADHMLPHLRGRPLMLQRFPDGIRNDGFYQKQAGDYFPDWIETVNLKKEGGSVDHVICNNKSTLTYLVNQGTVTFHTWLSTTDHIQNPDKLVIDLDPPGKDFEIVREAALALCEFFESNGIEVFVMTSGSRGIHVVIPLDAKAGFDDVRAAGDNLGKLMTDRHGEIFTREVRKNQRDGKLYFDIGRNAYAQTAVCPYSVRAVDGAPAATPIHRDELEDKSLHARFFTAKNLRRRLSQKEDPWKGMGRHAIGLKRLTDIL